MTPINAPNVRYVEVRHGDDLRRIALRELGSAARWLDLVTLNSLRPPYIAAQRSAGMLAYGDQLMVPAPGGFVSASSSPDEVFGTDMAVRGKRLQIADGDFEVVSGVPNLSQALSRRVIVEKRELAFHPSYGCHVRSLLGRINGPAAAQLAAFYVKSALLEDARVHAVPVCVAEVLGEQIRVTANVQPVSGRPVEMKLVV